MEKEPGTLAWPREAGNFTHSALKISYNGRAGEKIRGRRKGRRERGLHTEGRLHP
jgi:hypothetical protein